MVASDHEARALAKEALTRIDGHETLCTSRWEESRDALNGLKVSVTKLYERWWQIAAAMIVGLLGVVASAVWIGIQIAKLTNGKL